MNDIFSDNEAFELSSLVAAINEVDHIPGRAGQLVFSDPAVTRPISTLTITVERVGDEIKLVPTRARGAPGEFTGSSKRSVYSFSVPHLLVSDTILADSVQNVRQFGSPDTPLSVETAVNAKLKKLAARLDYTLENHRLGALKGVVTDADGTVLLDSFAAFGFLNSAGLAQPETFDFDLDNLATDSSQIRVKAQGVKRYMQSAAKTVLPNGAMIWAFCGDNFFDKLISRKDVKECWIGTSDAAAVLGANYAYGVFEFGGVMWENYRGSDDGAEISVGADEARFFFVGAPQLYIEAFAPADYIETVNTPGLPRYAKAAPDRMGKAVEIEAQSNPLPLSVNPATLCRAT